MVTTDRTKRKRSASPATATPAATEYPWIAEPLRPLAEPLERLTVDPQNARTHDAANVAAIAASLKQFGQLQPVVVNRENHQIIAGNGRFLAARDKLGWSHLAVVWVEHDPSAQRGYSVADNRTAELAGWDDDLLEAQLALIEEDSPDLYDELLLDELRLGDEEEADEDGPSAELDRAAELRKQWGTKAGQLWVIRGKAGDHRLLCGDSTKAEDVAAVTGNVTVNTVITDPPYGISHDVNYKRFTKAGTSAGKVKQRNWQTPIAGDSKPFDTVPWLAYDRVVLFGANCYSDKLPCGSWLVWVKKREVNYGLFMSDAEVAWMNHGHGVYVWYHEWDGINKASERGQSRQHPVQKPIALMRRLIEWARVTEGEVILDPFLGSGTTMVAAEQSGCLCYGMESEPKYTAVALQRMKDMGLEPVSV